MSSYVSIHPGPAPKISATWHLYGADIASRLPSEGCLTIEMADSQVTWHNLDPCKAMALCDHILEACCDQAQRFAFAEAIRAAAVEHFPDAQVGDVIRIAE